jgi:hypothetical protein
MSTCVSELRSKSIKSQNKKNISETLGTLSKISLSNHFQPRKPIWLKHVPSSAVWRGNWTTWLQQSRLWRASWIIVRQIILKLFWCYSKLNFDSFFSASAPTSIGRMPRSCDDLQRIGHRRSGLFPVMGNKTVDNVYCDFTKPNNAVQVITTIDFVSHLVHVIIVYNYSLGWLDFQKAIGYFDVKTSPVYFHVQRSTVCSTPNSTLPFEILSLNSGETK